MYRILYVDDEPGLLEISKLFLERSGQFIVDTITSAPDALALLDAKNYDAIISDYQMPGMDGIEFLKMVRTSGNTIPFILFTGRGREEVVIQALNEGADFYLQKGGEPKSQFVELSHQIRQAVRQKRAEASIHDLERREADIINFLPDATFAIDINGVVIAWNRAMEEITGVKAAEILGKGNYEYAIPIYHERQPIFIDLVLHDDPALVAKYPLMRREGRTLIAETTSPFLYNGRGATIWFIAAPLYNTQDTIIGAIESIRDITERKEAERALNESEERYRNVVEDQTEFICRFRPDGTHIFVNEAYCRYFSLNRKEILGHRFRPKIPEKDRERVKRFFASLTPDHLVDFIEHRIIMPDGSIRWQRWSDRAIFDKDGHIREYQSVGRDTTEQKTVENALRTSQVILTDAMDLAHLTYWEYDEQTGMFSFDNRFYALYGTTAEREGGYQMSRDVYFREFIHPDDRGRISEEVERSRKTSDPHNVSQLEHRIIRRDGEIRHIVVRIEFTTDNEGHVIKTQGVNQDITERKRAEEELLRKNEELQAAHEELTTTEEELRQNYDELVIMEKNFRENEERYRVLYNENPFMYFTIDAEGIVLSVNPYGAEQLGYSVPELLGQPVFSVFYPDDRSAVKEQLAASLEKPGEVLVWEFRKVKKDGTVIWVREFARAVKRGGDKPIILIVCEDITGAKRSVEALADAERLQRAILSASPVGIGYVKNRVLDWANDAMHRMVGYQQREIIGQSVRVLYPDDSEFERAGRILYSMGEVETRWVRKDGTVFDCLIRVANIDPASPDKGVIAAVVDITERKKMEKALRESEERYRAFFATSMDCVFITSFDGRWLDFNDPAVFFFGYASRDELEKVNVRNLYENPIDRKNHLAFIKEKGYSKEYPVNLKKKDGTIINTLITTVPIKDNTGTVIGFQGTIRDITERRKIMNALQRANQQLNLLTTITRHDILNKVTGMFAYIELIRDNPDPAEIPAMLTKLESATKTIRDEIEFTKSYQELGAREPLWLSLQDCIPQFDIHPPITFQSDIPPTEIYADPMLRKVFLNLLDNSLFHGGKVTMIRMNGMETPEGFLVTWEDNGIGIPHDKKEKIFELGYGRNSGLGLFLVREILGITGITIRETGESGKGARFEMMVPKSGYRFTGDQ
jgi:PAS domain S-box-containing protein